MWRDVDPRDVDRDRPTLSRGSRVGTTGPSERESTSDPREALTRELSLPRGPARERVRIRDHEYELRWYFEQRRRLAEEAPASNGHDEARYARARDAFGAPRYRVLYPSWLQLELLHDGRRRDGASALNTWRRRCWRTRLRAGRVGWRRASCPIPICISPPGDDGVSGRRRGTKGGTKPGKGIVPPLLGRRGEFRDPEWWRGEWRNDRMECRSKSL
jgi:hypothetical protein